MRNSAGQKDVSSRTQDGLLSIAEKGKFTTEHIERFVLDVVKMVGRSMPRRMYLVQHREGAACRL
jgi:hypothetical protein